MCRLLAGSGLAEEAELVPARAAAAADAPLRLARPGDAVALAERAGPRRPGDGGGAGRLRPPVRGLPARAPDEPGDVAWRRAQAHIAAELLARSHGSDPVLRALQQRVLVPLELATDDATSPERVVELAVDELRRVQA